ncbi:MAG: hypothetical protein AB1782_18210 [Cyanobacteriota bacterium]
MKELLTSEDIVIFLIALAILYSALNFVQKKIQGFFDCHKEIYKWGLNLKLTDSQQNYLLYLWFNYKTSNLVDNSMSEKITAEEIEELKRFSGIEILPENLKQFYSANKRLKTIEKIVNKGYTKDQAIILSGLIYNKIGGIHAIKSIPSEIEQAYTQRR